MPDRRFKGAWRNPLTSHRPGNRGTISWSISLQPPRTGSFPDFHIISLIFDDIVEGAVYTVGLNLNQILIINPGVPVPAVDLWPFHDVIMPGVLIKILYAVHHIEIRIIFKYTGYIFMEMNPILPVKEKHTDANQVRDILMVIAPAYILKPFKMFVALCV